MGKPNDGVILIDKEGGRTSFDVVRQVRRFSGIKKVGHAGTLDPFATGLLIVMLGEGTKLSPHLTAGEKIYQATMRLGVETDTLDQTGDRLPLNSWEKLSRFLLNSRQSTITADGHIPLHEKGFELTCRKERSESVLWKLRLLICRMWP